jgi:intron-binding protein aquarius
MGMGPSTAWSLSGLDFDADMQVAQLAMRRIESVFDELEQCRPFELLRSFKDRGDLLLTRHAKIIAMTCTHAALKRRDLIELGFQYDNIIMEESAQILEIETFIPYVIISCFTFSTSSSHR